MWGRSKASTSLASFSDSFASPTSAEIFMKAKFSLNVGVSTDAVTVELTAPFTKKKNKNNHAIIISNLSITK